jgi:tRNA-modifying protein YgfZ
MNHDAGLGALLAGEAFVDLSAWRKVSVSGSDARTWLNDLVSADIGHLGPGEARRSLMLSPNGRIRAEFTVAVQRDATLLLQDPGQPASIRDLLAPYVLSSDVRMVDESSAFALFAFPGLGVAPDERNALISAPSCVGAGIDLLCPMSDRDALVDSLSGGYARAGSEALEAWRVSTGIPRFGVDAREDDLPQEGGLGDAVAFDKGCYLGQEAMAKVRNLGHPRRTLLHLEADEIVAAGDAIESEGRRAGEITSAVEAGGRWMVLAKVRWAARDAALAANGTPLSPYHP